MFAMKGIIFIITLFIAGFTLYKSLRLKGTEVTGINPIGVLFSAGIMLFTLAVLLPSFGQVPAGFRGVVLRFGAVTGEIKNEGLYFIPPFINTIQLMNVQVHADKSKATAASRDLQNVATEVTVNYRLDADRAAEVYRDLRDDYVVRVMVPAIQEAVKSATAQFDAENLIRERPKVKETIETYLQFRLKKHGLLVDGIAITDFQFSADFAKAIEAKVTSQQLALKAQNDLQIIKAEAQQTIETAKATAEAIRIQANAINAQGGRDYVQLQAIAKWNGELPGWITGGSAMPFINISPK